MSDDAAEPTTITELLASAQAGDADAQEQLARRVYAELHGLAEAYLSRERAEHTLQPTALVHEAYLRLIGQESPWRNRSHFFGVAASMMRRVLVDHARRSSAARRDGGVKVALTTDAGGEAAVGDNAIADVLGVHDALGQLEKLDPRQARIVELKFFVGLQLDEIAQLLDISPATVSREWSMARAWLHSRLSEH